jgi:hypothetical protein
MDHRQSYHWCELERMEVEGGHPFVGFIGESVVHTTHVVEPLNLAKRLEASRAVMSEQMWTQDKRPIRKGIQSLAVRKQVIEVTLLLPLLLILELQSRQISRRSFCLKRDIVSSPQV